MGRRKDDPVEQAAKGFPGRRKSAVEREIDAIAKSASSAKPTSTDPWPMPQEFQRSPAYYRRAIDVWERQSDALMKAGRRRPSYLDALARYCMWQMHFYAANESIRKHGLTVKHVKGDGNEKVQANPALDVMKSASIELRLLEEKFGFTPVSDQTLVRVESFNATQRRLPLEGAHPSQPKADDFENDEQASDPMDLMNSADSPPPGTRPN